MAGYLFLGLVVFVNLMGTFRYTFRYGEPLTSPEYSPVPHEYFLVWDLCIVAMLMLLLFKTTRLSLKGVLLFLPLAGFCINTYTQASNFFVLGYAKSILLYGFFGLLLFSDNRWLKPANVNKALQWMSLFMLIFLAWQVFQYIHNDILPSHSHRNSLIRFGSIWDDSLVFGALLPMFAGYHFEKYRDDSTRSAVVAIILNLAAVMTGSLTAIGVSLLYTFLKLFRYPATLLLFVCALALVASQFMGNFEKILAFKTGSIAGHLDGWSLLANLGIDSAIGIVPTDHFAESGILMLLMNFGLPVMVLIVIIHLYTLAACRPLLQEGGELGRFAGAAEGLIFSVLLFSLNLPVVILSPVYLFTAIFSSMVLDRSFLQKRHYKVVPAYGG